MPGEPETAPPTAPAAANQVLTPAVITVFTAIASQAALITALLYFFGRVHADAMYNYFGVDASLLGFSTSDYVIGSLNATLPPVMLCALAILAVPVGVKRLDRAVNLIQQRPRIKRMTVIATAVVFVVCLIIVLNGISPSPWASYSRGYPLPIAVLGIAVAVGMGRRLVAPRVRSGHATDPLWSMTLAAFALAGVLWVTDIHVAREGNRDGRYTADNLRSSTSCDFVLFSVDKLAIHGQQIEARPIPDKDQRYHFQYSGLRLLIRTPREYIILPAYWTKGQEEYDHVFVVPVNDSTRFDLIPKASSGPCSTGPAAGGAA